MINRLIYLRKFLNLSQENFAKKIGITRPALSAIETKRCELTESNKIIICNIFHVNRIWLESGEGEMFVYYNELEEEFFEIFKSLNSTLQSFLLNTAKNLLDIQDEIF